MIRTTACATVLAAMMIAATSVSAGVFVGVEDQTAVAPTSGTTTVNIELFIELTDDASGNDTGQTISSYNLPVDLIGDPTGIAQVGVGTNSIFGNGTTNAPLSPSSYAEYGYADAGTTQTPTVSPGAGRTKLVDIELELDSTVLPGTYDIRINTTQNPLPLFEITYENGDPIDVDGSTVGTLTVIPEPTTVAMLGLGGLALLRRRRAG